MKRPASTHPFKSFRARLGLLLAAVLVPAALLAAWLISEAYKNERRATERHLTAAARSISLVIDGTLRQQWAMLKGLATSSHLQQRDYAAFQIQAAAVTRGGDSWVVLLDRDGQQLINTLPTAPSTLPRIAMNPEFLAASLADKTYVSNVSLGAVSGRPVLYVSLPVGNGMALCAALSPRVFIDALSEGHIPQGWVADIIDRTGVISARHHAEETIVGTRISRAVADELAHREEGIIESVDLDAVSSLAAFHRSALSGWMVLVGAPRHDLLASAQQLVVIALAVSAILGGLGTMLAIWIGRGVVEAIQGLVRDTEALGRGERVTFTSTGIVETDIVARALEQTSQQRITRERELGVVRDEALAALRAKDDFLAALSHELRTPLSPVLLIASDAANNPNHSPAAREAFDTIAKNAALEAKLIDDLLDLTRINRGKIALQLQLIDLHTVLREALATVQGDIQARQLTLSQHLRATHTKLNGDPIRLQQVFWNILSNAVKFTPAGGHLTVETSADPDTGEIEVVVIDSGIGMTEAELGRVFRAFAQGDHAAAAGAHQFGGLGLGLAISKTLVELHTGRIQAFSAGRDKGSLFKVTLPLHHSREPVPKPAPAKPLPASGTPPPDAGCRILLVEDHEPTRITISRLLLSRGYTVMSAHMAGAALTQAQQYQFDLLLSDIGLPDFNGYILMSKLLELQPQIRGIALSGFGMEDDIARARAAGFVTHLTKPVRIEALERALAYARSTPVA